MATPRTKKTQTAADAAAEDALQPSKTHHAHTTSSANSAPVAAEAKKAAPKARAQRKKVLAVVERGKRKESVARASVKKGKGVLRINSFKIETIQHPYHRALMLEPVKMAGDLAKDLDIDVDVYGGGQAAQAEAVRQAIARGILKFTGSAELKERMEEKDRYMLVEDSRRVEPKKYKGPKARARFQKSYR